MVQQHQQGQKVTGKLRYWLSKKRVYMLLALVVSLFYGYDFLELRIDDEAFGRILAQNPFGYEATFDYYEDGGRRVRYLEIGHDSLPLIAFIHGAPSSSSFWEVFLTDSTLLSQAKLLAVDRPGYGYSGYGDAQPSVRRQAELIARILQNKREDHEAIVVHGSSYGGTVAARLAMDYPDLVDGLLLQSASVMPDRERTFLFTRIVHELYLNALLPGSIQVANREKLAHKAQLDSMSNRWNRIRSASIILHGEKDELIYPENAEYAAERMDNASYLELKMLEDRKHDLIVKKPRLLVQSLLKLIDITSQNVNPRQ